MANNKPIQITKDLPNKKVIVHRNFEAAPELVWRAWTESKLLDKWWAPRPWVAKTKNLVFEEGGKWHYAMVGPEGNQEWCMVEFSNIKKNKSFESTASFCDESGIRNKSFPTMYWKNAFVPEGSGTRVEVEISFTNESDLQQIIDMGFEAGFTSGLGNLEELLAKKREHQEL